MKWGLRFSTNHGFTIFEKEIVELLNENGCGQFQVHSIIEGVKKRFNVDFVVENNLFPKVVIEVFTFNRKKIP
ncbi:MAG: hypothetical protein QMD36_02320 [Candidatus Aenigmarchaeota archaeon]|nr:hypothetical protein [Candidatus Aenigmarchaeota archaeon]